MSLNSTEMTVAQIGELLSADDVPPAIIHALSTDSRASVVHLLTKWNARQAKQRAETTRLSKLYCYERECLGQGHRYVAGIDEAGRGPLAGPVVVAAAILPVNTTISLLNDSKKLTAKQRLTLYDKIKAVAIAVNSVIIDVNIIDEINIYKATVQGMYEAVAGLTPAPDAVLIDAVPLPDLKMYSLPIIGGDAVSASIGAASIIAKVERDQIMLELDRQFPQYGFARHKGYGTKEHLTALRTHGPCPAHRKSFQPVKNWDRQTEQSVLF
jgi:ribonuclease HII